MAKVVCIVGLAGPKLHAKDPNAPLPATMVQAATRLNTVLHRSSHPTPALFAACLKSGRACPKGAICVPVLRNPLMGSFTHFDASRSKETLTPKSQAWAGYASEIMAVAAMNKAEPLLAAELDLDWIIDQLRNVYRKNWAGGERHLLRRSGQRRADDPFHLEGHT